MPGEQYRHIFLGGPNRTLGFTNPRRPRSSFLIPTRDRTQHSDYLRRKINDAWDTSAQEYRAVSHAERHGIYIEFIGEAGFNLKMKSLESRKSGIRLLNVRKEIIADQERTYATVYIPNAKRGHFIRKVNAYASEETTTGKPKNNDLINSISDLRLAVLNSFWQDKPELIPGETPVWIEVWLSTDQDQNIEYFKSKLNGLQIEHSTGIIKFPERSVLIIRANYHQLETLILSTDDIAEFRAAKEIASFFIELENREQIEWARDLLNRTEFDDTTDIAVCILDSGINNGHMLIRPLLDEDNLHTVNPDWGTADDRGHGTLMAGIAAYGDMTDLLSNQSTVHITHKLESAKILPPPPEQNPEKLWGFYTEQGIYKAEIQNPDCKRIVCLAVTSIDFRDRGRPSSWSGALDNLCSGSEGDKKRFIIVSAGNVDIQASWLEYFDDNLTNEIHDPGQAWNTLTVGAFTEKADIRDRTLEGYQPVAPPGGLSPFSTTSLTWPTGKWPIKPDEKISEAFDVTVQTIEKVRKQLVEEGFDAVLSRREYIQKVSRKKIDGDMEARLIALCCSDPPEGRVRWTLRLLADKVVELGYVDNISYEAVRQTLKKTNLNLG